MRIAFIASFLANLTLAIVSLVVLPDRVAIHFGRGGVPDAWSDSLNSTLLTIGIQVFLFCIFYLSPRLLTAVPSRWISLPNRDYWLRPEHRPRALEVFGRLMWQLGTALFLFMFFAGLLTLRANLSDPVVLDERVLLMGLAVFLAYTLFWVILLLRAFRIPKGG